MDISLWICLNKQAKHHFLFSLLKGPWCSETLQQNEYASQILVSIHHFSLKRVKTSWMKSPFQIWNKESNKVSLEYSAPESVPRLMVSRSIKKTQEPTWKGFTVQIWDSLIIEKKNDCNGYIFLKKSKLISP